MSSESQASNHAPQQDDSEQAQDQAPTHTPDQAPEKTSQKGQDGHPGNDYRDNVDAAEVAKFEALASRWWDKDSEFKPLHEINPLRLDFIDARAGLAGKRVIDVGCGGGILAEAMAHRGARVTGIDMGEAPLAVARLHREESGVEVDYRQASAEEMAAEQPGAYDIVTCLEMLEHVPDPAAVVRACATLVKPGGQVFFSTINRNPKAYAFAILGAEYVLRLLPRGTHDYKKFIRPAELAGWGRAAGLHLGEQTGLTYNPLTRRYRLDANDVSVNYMIQTRRETT
ncbi:MAG: bifunctional 2-polyprenyl-6-hydroxyphenol methylase/3-demethylubiquinol 3-O-methyltransferase UbiG [Onishia taeanensis]|uniref:bifunctional 2-polyprenyl-6-hydroxyphenol methylase/3-demethylubiquinol 3-O-methyltransferase UbiG n=1 Tax=Onishia taeanensis TaxID=284577 RepID=UPI003C7D970F